MAPRPALPRLLLALVVLGSAATHAGAGPRLVDADDLLRDGAGVPVRELEGFGLVRSRIDSALVLTWREAQARPADHPARAELEVRLTPRDDGARAFERTPSFDVNYATPPPGGPDERRVLALTRAVAATVRLHDPGGLGLALSYGSDGQRGVWRDTPPPRITPRDLFDDLALRATFALLLAWLALLPFGVLRATRDVLRPAAALPPDRVGWLALAALSVGLLLRLGLPYRLVLYYLGYEQTQIAASLHGIPKYGPAGFALYHLAFLVDGPSHVTMIAVNRVLGALLPLFGAAVLARVGAPRAAVGWAAWLLAALPLFPRNAVTESLLVPMLAWLLSGTHAALAWRSRRDLPSLGLLAVGLLLAMLSRPEALGLAPLTLVVLARTGPHAPRRHLATAVAVGGAAALLLAVRLVQLRYQMLDEIALGNTPQLVNLDLLEWGETMAWSGLVARNAALWPTLFPVAATLLALLAAVRREGRRIGVALLLLSLPWFAASRLDLPYMSMPRVQEPALTLLALAAALGAAGLVAWARALRPRAGQLATALTVAALAGSSVLTVPALFEGTNADDEEAFLADALPLLPVGRLRLARRGFDDPPAERIPMHFPDYLVAPAGRTLSLQQLLDRPLEGPTFVYLGTRCHLRRCEHPGEHPACVAVRERFRLRPLLERDVARRELTMPGGFREDGHPAAGLVPDHDFPYCALAGTHRIGLYEVLPRGDGDGRR